MCAIFGLIDYKGYLLAEQRLKLVSALAQECESRGSDATGIAYVHNGRMCVHKAGIPASKFQFYLPMDARIIMGHTRAATQGDARCNCNNHPFMGRAGALSFALAHNGIIQNDVQLRQDYNLTDTKIETDSYVAVQLLESFASLADNSLRSMAESLLGSFMITILDQNDTFYFLKGGNPITLYHFEEEGYYVYASTEGLLRTALASCNLLGTSAKQIHLEDGDILKVSRSGRRNISKFAFTDTWGLDFYNGWEYSEDVIALEYVVDYLGLDWCDIKKLLDNGHSAAELFDMLWKDKSLDSYLLYGELEWLESERGDNKTE